MQFDHIFFIISDVNYKFIIIYDVLINVTPLLVADSMMVELFYLMGYKLLTTKKINKKKQMKKY